MENLNRPKFLSIFCIVFGILLIIGLYGFLVTFDQRAATEGTGSAFIAIIFQILALTGLYGLWKMKKWGAYILFVYAGLIALDDFHSRNDISNTSVSILGLLAAFIPAVVSIIYFKMLD